MSFSPSGMAVSAAAEAELTDSDATSDASSGPVSKLIGSIETDRRDSFVALGSAFLTRLPASPLPAPYLVGFSADTAAELGFNVGLNSTHAQDPAFIDYFTGNTTRDLPADELPYASVYSGHQFGVWAGQLGDGRAMGLGEIEHDGKRLELQLKGAGRTPYSRMGDGRAVLRSSIREYLCSEAMHHLGIPTTRALCVIGSDQPIRRETMETAAVVTRVAPSFVRFGHFEHFYTNDRLDELKKLTDHVIDRFYPQCREADDPALALLQEVMHRTADLMADWQAVGFCHGVMNTDNMSILGLTIDYGPFGFIDGFNANHICNHSDSQGRYAYKMQPQIGYWNLFCLAQALVPLFGPQYDSDTRNDKVIEDAQRVLEGFKDRFAPALERRMRAKLGLAEIREGDDKLASRLFEVMNANRADFTLTFRNLAKMRKADASGDAPVRDLFLDRAAFDVWANDYRLRLSEETQSDEARASTMNAVNPKYVLRNHLAENAIRLAKEKDFSEVERLAQVLRHPFDEQPEFEAYAGLPPDWASDLEVSCSS